MVVDSVVRHWMLLMEGGAGGQDKWGMEVIHYSEFLYVDDALVTLTDPVWLQGALDTLIGWFGRVGIQEKFGKTVGTICHTFRVIVTQSEAAYKWRIMGEGLKNQTHHRLWFQLPNCVTELTAGLLVVHRKTQRGVGMGGVLVGQWETPPLQTIHRRIGCLYQLWQDCKTYP